MTGVRNQRGCAKGARLIKYYCEPLARMVEAPGWLLHSSGTRGAICWHRIRRHSRTLDMSVSVRGPMLRTCAVGLKVFTLLLKECVVCFGCWLESTELWPEVISLEGKMHRAASRDA
jgi:hypothetical protein